MRISTPLRQRLWPKAREFRTEAQIERVWKQSEKLRRWPDRELAAQAQTLRMAVQSGTADEMVAPAFALACEAMRRVLGISPYDVQLVAGLALARGSIAEMQTGEGKTLAAALAAFHYSLAGEGVHVATTNAYLAQRDREQLAPVFRLLGATCGLNREQAPPAEKQAAYGCDITYGTGYEFGFDYLRDQLGRLKRSTPELGRRYLDRLRGVAAPPAPIQRGHAVAIIDEVDSVLLDEACMPLVLSAAGSGQADPRPFEEARRLAESLVAERDYHLDPVARQVWLTPQGLASVHARPARCTAQLARAWPEYVTCALRARWLLNRDVDYIVTDGRVVLVDELTGRAFAERTWRDGLHQAVEAKEGLAIRGECATAARISRQRYFRLYRRICGLTGTAAGSEREFWRLYRLPVCVVPLRCPSRRTILPERFFGSFEAKLRAILNEIESMHRTGRPVLVGARTIETSEHIARRLSQRGLDCSLLNGRQDQDEADLVARAGRPRAITIATNMAGRGTDIRLAPGVAELGGLHLIGVEHNASARIDRQLMGRVARQGEPGSCRFFTSAEDALIGRFAPELRSDMQTSAGEDGELTHDHSRQLAAAQRRAESAAYAERRRLLSYDHWLEDLLSHLAS
jgi:preprotein translocase subunit SecA